MSEENYSDGDSLADGLEDSDRDGVRNIDEVLDMSDPASADTTGDGVTDGVRRFLSTIGAAEPALIAAVEPIVLSGRTTVRTEERTAGGKTVIVALLPGPGELRFEWRKTGTLFGALRFLTSDDSETASAPAASAEWTEVIYRVPDRDQIVGWYFQSSPHPAPFAEQAWLRNVSLTREPSAYRESVELGFPTSSPEVSLSYGELPWITLTPPAPAEPPPGQSQNDTPSRGGGGSGSWSVWGLLAFGLLTLPASLGAGRRRRVSFAKIVADTRTLLADAAASRANAA